MCAKYRKIKAILGDIGVAWGAKENNVEEERRRKNDAYLVNILTFCAKTQLLLCRAPIPKIPV
jgi:hypothetical protein